MTISTIELTREESTNYSSKETHIQCGTIVVITGPMFSEKSGELIRRLLKLEKYGRKKVKAYKPSEDTRFSENEIVSRIGYTFPATNIPKKLTNEVVNEILEESKKFDIIAFDETQFFEDAYSEDELLSPSVERMLYLVEELTYRGKDVILDGLNMDFRAKGFGAMPYLMVMADEVVKLSAFCACCGSPNGTHTQRILNGKPAKLGPIIIIGDTEEYEPRCRTCFVPPTKA